jgi:CheY-like chemotaxis protein
MTQVISKYTGPAEPPQATVDFDILSGGAGGAACGAKLPRQPSAPSDHAAAPLLDLGFDPDDPIGPALAEADRPVALVIEDDPSTRARIMEILTRAGWSVWLARDGEQGLVLAREHLPDVILLDLSLPKMSGLDVLRELRDPAWTDAPPAVVVVSFFAMLLALRHLWLADAVVQKPFGAAELLGQIALARARHRAPVLT